MYRIIVSAVAIVVFAAGGAWAAYMLPYPLLLSAGAGVGLAVGGLCTFFLLHEFHHARSRQTSRVRRTPPH
ncbi:MAG TPA: hypothetical protein VFG63_11845 [Nocardioidaceae bacterium]|nr:hypothetical protein [Nocardioidaceae bacterium]